MRRNLLRKSFRFQSALNRSFGALAARSLVPYFFAVSLCCSAPCAQADDWRNALIRGLRNGGAYVESETGEELFSSRSTERFIPASTMKVLTGACALEKLGPDFRFSTEFFLLPPSTLGIRGQGDPGLTSEEIDKIAGELAAKLPERQRITKIVLDTSYFAPGLMLDGYEDSTNPYDAFPTVIAANFNTIFLERTRKGVVLSAEPQTPLTKLGEVFGSNLSKGTTQRVNLGKKRGLAEQYFTELLLHFLKDRGREIKPSLSIEKIPADAEPFFTHRSSRPLEEMLPGMFEFSTNFTANELFLVLGAKTLGAPATAEKAIRALSACARKSFGWEHAEIFDGAGLSHRNRVTPREYVRLLAAFRKHRSLLRIDRRHFQAKTGTLRGVNSYAGYFDSARYGEVRFALFVNDSVPFEHRWKLAEILYSGLH